MEELTTKVAEPKPGSTPAADVDAAARAIDAFLTALGHAPRTDPQLHDTGRLVATAFAKELLRGYAMNPAELLAESIAADGGDLVVIRNIDVTCVCPHHLMPASGVLHIGYVPRGRVVGFGALARLAECFSRRLTLQEALCENIAEALVTHLGAAGAGCIADLEPACLTARGAQAVHAHAVTAATAGTLRTDAAARAELFALCGVAPREAATR